MSVQAKICGLKTPDAVDAAVVHGAFMTGFVFFSDSPRNILPFDAAQLTARVPKHIGKVGLVVDASNDWLDEVVKKSGVDYLQCHGQETPDRISEISTRYQLPVIKALAIENQADIERARLYQNVSAKLLFDARPPKGATRPGGNAVTFDWTLLADESWTVPWLLAGGINVNNVKEAVLKSDAKAVDVSSAVETVVGVKSVQKITEFLKIVATL